MTDAQDTKALKKMYELLTISNFYSFQEFLNAEKHPKLRNISWPVIGGIPVRKVWRKNRGKIQVRFPPRIRFKGKQDTVIRALFRHFVSDDIDTYSIRPEKRVNKDDYNPWRWKKSSQMRQRISTKPQGVKTAPKAIDPEIKDLIDLIEGRKRRGQLDIWEGIDEIYTALEIAKAKNFIDVENKT